MVCQVHVMKVICIRRHCINEKHDSAKLTTNNHNLHTLFESMCITLENEVAMI